MLDPATGELELPSTGVRLGPSWTRTRFLGSWLGQQAKPQVINEPWASYWLEFAPDEVGPFPATVSLYFRGETLYMLSIMDISPEFGTGWADWSEEKERARRAAHDRWLAASGAPAGPYPWAQLWSDFDPKSALSSIVIRYDWATRKA